MQSIAVIGAVKKLCSKDNKDGNSSPTKSESLYCINNKKTIVTDLEQMC